MRYDLHQNHPGDSGYVNFLNRLAVPMMERLRRGASGLDFGCGPGPAMSMIFREKGYAMEDYDPIYRNETDLLGRKYDFVTSSEVVEHFYEPRREFEVFDRLLKEKAFLGIMTGILEEEASFEKWWYPNDPTHVCFYQRKTFEWIAAWRSWTLEIPGPNIVIFQK